MSTIHAASAAASARYYAQYLTAAPGEEPGVWVGAQAGGLGLSGTVEVAALEALLSGRDPGSGAVLGRELLDRVRTDGRVVPAVAGFDATFSAPKSLSVWWGLTGDARLLEAHDVAVAAALAHLERFGSTTRVRVSGGRVFPETGGLTMATFRQTTSRADDPQIHTHAVISSKVQIGDGRWFALDARYLKRHQRMLGGLYQSVLRAELTARFGVGWERIVHGQAELAGMPPELLSTFSKRTAAIDDALEVKLDDFRRREGRDPSRWEQAALTREASADTRARKTGNGAGDLTGRWAAEAADVGWSPNMVVDALQQAGIDAVVEPAGAVPVVEVVEALSSSRSTWDRADVLQALCDRQRPVARFDGRRWAAVLEAGTDRVLDGLVDLDPVNVAGGRRVADGRSVWIEPTAARFTSEAVLAQEERVVSWALLAQADDPAPSITVTVDGLDPLQATAARSVAGTDRLVLVVGPAGAGKTRTLAAAVDDLRAAGRVVVGVSPTAKAARVLARDTGMYADTVAKLIYDWQQPSGLSGPLAMPAGGTLIVDEAGMLATPALHDLIRIAEQRSWRLVLVGDPRQLQAVGRGGLLTELCGNGRVEVLEQLHRFTQPWEAAASLQLRVGDPRALDAYQHHGRISAGPLDEHLATMATAWLEQEAAGRRVALVASTNDHVELINRTVQHARRDAGHLDTTTTAAPINGGSRVWPGEVVMTRRNDRRLLTDRGEPVRNRELWTVTGLRADGGLDVTRRHGAGDRVTLPGDYVTAHVQLGYSATAHGYQADTVDTAYALVTAATSRRGLYVAATRGRDDNQLCVVTDSTDVAEARDALDGVLAVDRADVPAVAARRELAEQAAHAQTPGPVAGRPAARCEMPDWFAELLAGARQTLVDAHARQRDLETRQAEVDAEVAAATERLHEIAQHTANDRGALEQARRRADDARRQLERAERRLDRAPWRQRRAARRDVDEAHTRHDRASDYLRHVQARTAPAVEEYTQAVDAHRLAVQDRDNHHTIRQLDRLDRSSPNTMVAAMRVQALEVWSGWASGAPVTDHQLRVTRQTLAQMPATAQTRHLIDELTTDPAFARASAHHVRGDSRDFDRGWEHDVGPDRSDGVDFGR